MISRKITINNLDIYYRVEENSLKPTLLWLDGLSISKDLFGRLNKSGKFLSNFFDDFNVISLEYPSFMRSSIPEREWKIEDYTKLIHEFILKVGIKKPMLLMGHSMGAMLSYAYTAKYSEDVKLLVISAPPATYQFTPKHLKLFNLLEKLIINIFNSKHISDKVKKLIPKYFMSTSNENLNKYSINRFETAVASFVHMVTEDYYDLASKITTKTIMITGSKDFLVPVINSINLKDQIKNCIYHNFNEGHTTLPWRIVELKPGIVKMINE